uniref:PRMT5 arginine-N-methyltransferase domain-containing protein n=1 Tax=Daphnia galeata TaxID=27404 RepID=A0A8J2WPP0_9CRUS|nr:unnamed protein product [Daphnia galeata]
MFGFPKSNALEQTADLPDAEDIERWLGEPIKCRFVPTRLIIHVHDQQERISRSSQVPQRSHPSIFASKDANSHHWSSASSTLQALPVVHGTHVANFLIFPLQHLMDNLETYEVFEKVPVKSTEYQRAITLMVIGAGRGPLVRAALTGAEKAERHIRVYAVETNPDAIVTLQCLADEEWGD